MYENPKRPKETEKKTAVASLRNKGTTNERQDSVVRMWSKVQKKVLGGDRGLSGEDIPLIGGKNGKQQQQRARKILRARTLFASFIESKELQERRRKLHTSCVGAAAFLIRDAVLGEDEVEDPTEGSYNPYADESKQFLNNVSIQCRRWSAYSSVLKLLNFALFALIVLTFFEGPEWCRDAPGGCHNITTLKGIPAGSSSDSTTFLYPTTRTAFIDENGSFWVESTCLMVVASIIALRIGRDGLNLSRYLRPSHVQTTRLAQLVSLCFMALALLVGDTRWQPYLRLALLLSFMSRPKREIRVLIGMLPVSTDHSFSCSYLLLLLFRMLVTFCCYCL